MENYQVIEKIGKGSFGLISKIKRKSDGKILVWKEFNYSKATDREKHHIITEINVLKQFNHPNIVKYYDCLVDKKDYKVYIVMEYCEGGDLSKIHKEYINNNTKIPEDIIWKIIYQILLALNECHNHKDGKILHRDIKPANIFIDINGNAKLGDFGLARILNDQNQYAYSNVGTPYYMSPEQISNTKYNEKTDIWSAGCLLYEISSLYPPFRAQNQETLGNKIKSGKFERIPIQYSMALQHLIELMLKVDPEERPGVDILLKHPIFTMFKRELDTKPEDIIKQKIEQIHILEEKYKQVEKIFYLANKRDMNTNIISNNTRCNTYMNENDNHTNRMIREDANSYKNDDFKVNKQYCIQATYKQQYDNPKIETNYYYQEENSTKSMNKHQDMSPINIEVENEFIEQQIEPKDYQKQMISSGNITSSYKIIHNKYRMYIDQKKTRHVSLQEANFAGLYNPYIKKIQKTIHKPNSFSKKIISNFEKDYQALYSKNKFKLSYKQRYIPRPESVPPTLKAPALLANKYIIAEFIRKS